MNESLIKEIIQRIINDPAVRQQLLANQPLVKQSGQEVLILLNYVPNLAATVDRLSSEWAKDYQVSVLGTDAVLQEKLTLPAGMRWISIQEAIQQHNWQRVILPTCSANTLAKIALGVRDTSVCELAGRAIAQGIPVELVTDYLGFTPQTPLAYRQLYAGYLGRLRKYGVTIKDQLNNLSVLELGLPMEAVVPCEVMPPVQVPPAVMISEPVQDYIKTNVICWEGKLLTEQDAVNLPEESVIRVAKKAIISPLAKDKLRQRNIEVVREMEV